MFRVENDADDTARRTAEADRGQERVFVGPIARGRGLVDQNDLRRFGGVTIAKEAAPRVSHLHRLEITGAHGAIPGHRCLPGPRRLATLYQESGIRIGIRHRQHKDDANAFNAGERLHAVDQPVDEGRARRTLIIGRPDEVQLRCKDAARIETRVHLHERREAPDEKARAHEQREGHGDLEDDERRTKSLGPAARASSAFFQTTVKIGLRGGNSRNQTKSQARQNRDDEREAERMAIHGDLGEARHALRYERQQKIHAPERQDQTHRASKCREQQALRQELPEEPQAARAHRDARRDFPLAIRGARQHEARHVGIGNEQDESHGAEEHPKGRAHIGRARAAARAPRRHRDSLRDIPVRAGRQSCSCRSGRPRGFPLPSNARQRGESRILGRTRWCGRSGAARISRASR